MPFAFNFSPGEKSFYVIDEATFIELCNFQKEENQNVDSREN